MQSSYNEQLLNIFACTTKSNVSDYMELKVMHSYVRYIKDGNIPIYTHWSHDITDKTIATNR
jgi:hypothetical protein